MTGTAGGPATSGAPRSLVLERTLNHPPEKVWRALTQTPLLEEWLLKSDFRPVVGHRFNFRREPVGGWDGVIDCEVLEVEPPARLAYTWAARASPMPIQTVVTWTLTPVAAGTSVRMEQAGFRSDQKRNYGGARYGWTAFLDGLERVLDGLD